MHLRRQLPVGSEDSEHTGFKVCVVVEFNNLHECGHFHVPL